MQSTGKLDNQIASKTKAIIDLNQELNNKRNEYDAKVKELEKDLAVKSAEFVEKLAKMEAGLKTPDLTISNIRKDLENKEQELKTWEKDLSEISIEITAAELEISDREDALVMEAQEVDDKWQAFVVSVQRSLQQELITLKRRAEALDTRNQLLNRKQNALNDRIRSFQAAQAEILKT